MAKPSSKPKHSSKGLPPTLEQTASTIETNSKVERVGKGGKPINFNVEPDWATDFKTFATMNNLSMKELLYLEHEFFKKNFDLTKLKDRK